MTLDEFWSGVDRNGPIPEHRPELGPCWTYGGPQGDKVVQWLEDWVCGEELVGRHCGNPECVNVNHWFTGAKVSTACGKPQEKARRAAAARAVWARRKEKEG